MEARRTWWHPRLSAALAGAGLLACLLTASPPPASLAPAAATEPFSSSILTYTADDGVALRAGLGWFGTLAPRPLIVEDSPYAPDVRTLGWAGDAFNYLELQWRGTGQSGGSLDSAGPRDQEDLSGFLGWACRQPWSGGAIGLYGFSASAIVVYDSMHLPLPCVKAAALMSGTVDLYRDLLDIGGVPSPAVGSAVEAMIGGPWLANLAGRARGRPASIVPSAAGFAAAPLEVGAHQTEDGFWAGRSYRGDPNHVPVLADDGFYDVEERGAFQGYLATKADGSRLLVMGAHDGWPAGTPGPFPAFASWFGHYLLGRPDAEPAVQVELSDGSRQQFLGGAVAPLSGSDWPLPGTDWTDLYLSPDPSGTVASLHDGSLALSPPGAAGLEPYPFAPSEPSETDVHTSATVASDGLDQAATALPELTDMALSGPTSLTFTTPVLRAPVDAVGPVGLDLFASSTAPYTDLAAVVADVWPDGTAYPVATGWLRTLYPGLDPTRSLVDPAGDVVDPYNDFSAQVPALPGTTRQYHLEVLPIGNHFAAGHRIRLYVLGSPLDMEPAPPGLDLLSTGGATLSRLVLPTYGTSLAAALGG